MTAPRPLAGLRVLEMGALIAGPFCAKILAEFGADVVKIEPPGHGNPLRAGDGGTLKVPGAVPKLSRTPGGVDGGGPRLGEHTDDVLRELRYDEAAIAELRARKVV